MFSRYIRISAIYAKRKKGFAVLQMRNHCELQYIHEKKVGVIVLKFKEYDGRKVYFIFEK